MSDITERKKMEEKERQYFSDLAFLSKTAMELVEFTSKKDIHRYVGEQIRQHFIQRQVSIQDFTRIDLNEIVRSAITSTSPHWKDKGR